MGLARVLLAVALGLAASILHVTDARSKAYEVLSCGAAPSGASHAWSTFNTARSTLTAGSSCPPMANLAGELTGLSAHDTLKAPTETSPGASAGFVLAAPAGTLVTGWDYVGGVDKNGDDDWTVSLATAEGQAVETCTIPPGSGGCTSGSSYYSGELSYRRVRTGCRPAASAWRSAATRRPTAFA